MESKSPSIFFLFYINKLARFLVPSKTFPNHLFGKYYAEFLESVVSVGDRHT